MLLEPLLQGDRTLAEPLLHETALRYLADATVQDESLDPNIRTELGWTPQVPFEQGLAETTRWYAENREWWEPLRDRAPVVEDAGVERRGLRRCSD